MSPSLPTFGTFVASSGTALRPSALRLSSVSYSSVHASYAATLTPEYGLRLSMSCLTPIVSTTGFFVVAAVACTAPTVMTPSVSAIVSAAVPSRRPVPDIG